MAARKGTKNTALLQRTQRGESRTPVAYVVATRPLRHGNHTLTAGTEVPGAADWPRLEAWVSSRALRPVYEGDEYTTFDEYLEAYEFSLKVFKMAESLPVEDDERQE